jgi:hypothetical protein
VKVRIISGVGAITDLTMTLAESSEAVLLALTFVQITLLVKKLIKMVSIFVITSSIN